VNPVGVLIGTTTTPPEAIGPLAKRIEDLGYREVWVAEDYFAYGGFTAATIALQATQRVNVYLGIVSGVARHPAVTAMEIATLARAFPDRFVPGIGHGVPFWTDQMGLTPKSPLTALTEAVTSIRALLSGETVDAEGRQFAFHGVALSHPVAADIPILTGVVGPKSLHLSGKIADGTVMSVLCGTKYLDVALEHIRAGMKEGHRDSHVIPTLALFSIDRDRKIARAAVRTSIAFYLAALGPHNGLTMPYGYNDQLADMLSRGGPEVIAREMPEEWVDELAVAGDPDEVTARIQALLQAGATSVVLVPVNNETAGAELRFVAETVLPRFAD
jgi:5,10-methylenetetrahydromethanopterin reductase